MAASPDSAQQLAGSLQFSLSKDAEILLEPSSKAFQLSMSRWTDVNKQIPSAILQPACDVDVERIVQAAIQNKIPFAVKSGGNSPWSTISSPGWILDLSKLDTYSLDIKNQTATFGPGVLSKTINLAVEEHSFCIQSPGSALVSCVGFLLGGGSSFLNGVYGVAVDSLISARVLTAKGTVTCSLNENSDLFWAIKGAGQFFGVVTEVVMKIYPLEKEEGPLSWTVIFPSARIEEVAVALEGVSKGEQAIRSPGFAMITAAPGSDKPVIMVNVMHFRPEEEAAIIMAPFSALKPVQQLKKIVPWGSMTDAADMLASHGGLKTLHSVGMKEFDGKKFTNSLEYWEQIQRSGATCALMMYWFSTEAMQKNAQSSAWSHRDIGVWCMNFIAAPNSASHAQAEQISNSLFQYFQHDLSEKALFPNHWRGSPVEARFRGEGTIKKLGELKASWDPEGVFTREFLGS